MARDEKRVELKPVDETVETPAPVVRLQNDETPKRPDPIRLGGRSEKAKVSQRLDLPSREEIELRTHQPGIEVLIDTPAANPDALEQDWGGDAKDQKQVPWGWFVLIGLILSGAAIWSLSQVKEADTQAHEVREATKSVVTRDAQDEKEATELIERLDQAKKDFFASSSIEVLSRNVRQAARVRPLMEQYYAANPLHPRKVIKTKILQPLTIENSASFWMSSVELDNRETVNLILDVGEDGVPLVDWETYVCYQPVDWDKYAVSRPQGTTYDFRVYAQPDLFFSHEFADSSVWECFRLTTLNSDETLFGYARKTDPIVEQILKIIEDNQGEPSALILRLSLPQGLQSRRGLIIEKLLSPRWMYVSPPDSGS